MNCRNAGPAAGCSTFVKQRGQVIAEIRQVQPGFRSHASVPRAQSWNREDTGAAQTSDVSTTHAAPRPPRTPIRREAALRPTERLRPGSVEDLELNIHVLHPGREALAGQSPFFRLGAGLKATVRLALILIAAPV
jgi:hypothetical protein